MSNSDLEQHAFGYVVGDRVRVFTRTGYWTATVERITSAGRLNVRDSAGKLVQFLPHGKEAGARTSSVWSDPLRSIELKEFQEARALEVTKRARKLKAQRELHDRLDAIRAMDLSTQREEIVAQLDLLRNGLVAA